ncbi:MAG: hypothetical protein GY754_09925 [bacterium]|nr:hypothetical protein [bacterium]
MKTSIIKLLIIFAVIPLRIAAAYGNDNIIEKNATPDFEITHSIGIDAAYYPRLSGIGVQDSSDYGIKACYTFYVETLDYLAFMISANCSPVTIEIEPGFKFTPLAFFSLGLAAKIGTGWNIDSIEAYGLALNTPGGLENAAGIVSISEINAAFEFDLGEIIKGDWTHLVFSAEESITYQHFTGATHEHRYWLWEDDDGQNRNGFTWSQSFLVGYQMPLSPACINLIGFVFGTDQRITGVNDSTVNSGGWGSDFITWNFGPVINFLFNDIYSLTVTAQFSRDPNFTDSTKDVDYFAFGKIDINNKSTVYLSSIALSFEIEF